MIIREKEPANLEMPFGLLDGFITPNDQFYIRSHFPVPAIDPKTWRLRIEGAVESPVELTYDDLRARHAKTVPATSTSTVIGRRRAAVIGFMAPFGKVRFLVVMTSQATIGYSGLSVR